jgi:hypothetical protein
MGLTTNYGISVLEQRLKELQSDLIIIYDQLDQLQAADLALTKEPQTWEEVRIKRNILLQQSDWTMTTGCTVDQREWAKYRQILRDIPQVFKSVTPDKIKWPSVPSTAGPNTTPVE